MTRELFARPVGLGAATRRGVEEAGSARLRLAGGWLDFSGIETVERSAGGRKVHVVGPGEFGERNWGRHAVAAAEILEALRAPRPCLAGLPLDRPRIMGIVNLTPDSFSDGGRLPTPEAAVAHALRLEAEGADILDLGAESTRPGSDQVSLDEELARLLPVLEGLSGRTRALISVDTRKAEVMRRAAAAGADLLNDVSALSHDPEAAAAAGECGLPVVLMHALGDPKTMQIDPRYGDVTLEVLEYLERRIDAAMAAGIGRSQLIVDPGIGFGKTVAHNLQLLSEVGMFHTLGVPVLVGASRKRFIGALTGVQRPSERVGGSIGAALAAVGQGVQIVRVHDVAATREALTVWQAALAGEELGAPGA